MSLCQNCYRSDGTHEDYCHSHPDKAAARSVARLVVAAHIDLTGYPPDASIVWPFYKAPQCMRTWDLSSQDDADWIAIFPPGFPNPWWADEGHGFGCFDVDVIELPNGWQMRVGFHS